ncbi:helix-turn-helix domain-containing protein [Streptomyces natalensis]|uniref:Regulatory protein n=1 Tax=Streptomyces natalensis ATCC 27448 TaxID=1240678 RepID=A0A0D7CT69_9ACTN|nr:helix-turn-helix transcriptional regulator [Streptomyces natalensis]KIZ19050.1 regulatory protein [Streptomyces natalensis ATCC 27448]
MTVGPTTRRRQLGAELRRLRDRKGLTLEVAGQAVGISRATVNRYESNQGPVKWIVVEALCRAYEASDTEREAVVALAKTAKVQGWWKGYSDAIPEWITPLLTLEDEAVEECHWANAYVPGLLQTRAYATAVIQAAEVRADAETVERMVDVRMKRQEVLKREVPPHLWAIMDEAVIRRRVGNAGVMAEQLRHLCDSSKSPYVTLQALPFEAGAHAAESTGFIIIRGQEPSLDVVHLSNLSGALYLEKDAELERHRMVFEYLRSQALSASDSSRLLRTQAEQFAAQARKES